jgi:hypothetical protein
MARDRGTRRLGGALQRNTLIGVAVVIVALVVIDVVLVALALGRTDPATTGTPRPEHTYTSVPFDDHTSSPVATPSASATPDPDGTAQGASSTPSRHLLSAVDGREAWRASSASCSAAKVVLEHTVDAGTTWQPVALGADVRALWGMRATTSGLSILAAVGDECAPAERTSVDDGATWKAAVPGAAGAAITPDGLLLNGVKAPAPCPDPLDAFQGIRSAVVVCDTTVQWRSGTGAWVSVPLEGVRGVAVNDASYTLARVGMPECEGVQIATMSAVSVTPSTTAKAIGCLPADDDTQIAIDRAGVDVWMWVGDKVAVSSDGGTTW